jgi:hypothetical protein
MNITSHTRFGKSILVLYFQKYHFISPIDNKRKVEFLLKISFLFFYRKTIDDIHNKNNNIISDLKCFSFSLINIYYFITGD